MRILWVSHLIPYPSKTGALSRSCNLLRELCQYHDVDVIAFKQSDLITPFYNSEKEGLLDAEKNLNSYCKSFHYINIPVESQRLGKYWLAAKSLFIQTPYTINWLQSDTMHKAIQDAVSSHNYDAVHFDTISLMPYIQHIGNIPYTMTHHNIESHMLLRRAEKEPNFLKKLYFWQEGKRLEKIEKHVCSDAAMNIVCSDLDIERLSNIIEHNNAISIPNGVDTEVFTPDIDVQEEDRIIFYGVMDFYPNIEAMLFFTEEVWPELSKKHPEIKMDIIGKNPPQSLINAVKTYNNITLHGYVEELQPMINKASIFVCPIMDGGGTKLKMLDSMAMQKAIVCHPIAAEGLSITNNVHAIFAETSTDFVDRIIELLKNREQRLCLGEKGRQHVINNFTYKNLGKKLANIYTLIDKQSENQYIENPLNISDEISEKTS